MRLASAGVAMSTSRWKFSASPPIAKPNASMRFERSPASHLAAGGFHLPDDTSHSTGPPGSDQSWTYTCTFGAMSMENTTKRWSPIAACSSHRHAALIQRATMGATVLRSSDWVIALPVPGYNTPATSSPRSITGAADFLDAAMLNPFSRTGTPLPATTARSACRRPRLHRPSRRTTAARRAPSRRIADDGDTGCRDRRGGRGPGRRRPSRARRAASARGHAAPRPSRSARARQPGSPDSPPREAPLRQPRLQGRFVVQPLRRLRTVAMAHPVV